VGVVVSTLARGRIILAEVVDPQSRNKKVRPLVIVTATDEISEATPFVAIGVSTTFPHPVPTDCVPLPYHAGGEAKTGLRKPSVAVCSWQQKLTHADVIQDIGRVPDQQMLSILEKMKRLAEPPSSDAPSE
jgi:mRNA-degrading endonuclease toxin of MazEF toxin-antitoxin module